MTRKTTTMRLPVIVIFMLILSLSLRASAKEEEEPATPSLSLYTDMLTWLESHDGGYFNNEKLEVRNVDPKDPKLAGIVARTDIDPGESLMKVPKSCYIALEENEIVPIPNDDDEADFSFLYHWENICRTSKKLAAELKLGTSSQYVPYIAYLETRDRGQIPTTWSTAGKGLLKEMMNINNDDYGPLPPGDMDFMEERMKGCIMDDDSDQQSMEFAVETVIVRGNDDHLIPVWDMMNHDNGKKINVNSTSIHSKEGVHVFAAKRIQKGEELYFSYNQCLDCADTTDYWGTPEILRDFGFVENYPQIWIFLEQDIGFSLYYDEDDDEQKNLLVLWDEESHRPDAEQKQYLKYNLDRLLTLGDGNELYSKNMNIQAIPLNEWNMIIQYYRAVVVALETVLKDAEKKETKNPTVDSSSPHHSSEHEL